MAAYTAREVRQIRAELTMHYQEQLLRKDKEFQEKIAKLEETAAQEKAHAKAENDLLKNKIKSLQGKLKSLKYGFLIFTFINRCKSETKQPGYSPPSSWLTV